MKILYTDKFPFIGKDFIAINLFGVLIARKGKTLTPSTVLHERIHSLQMREMLYVFFYLWYVTEWLVLLFKYKDRFLAYKNIRFEKEAYRHGDELHYLRHRKRYAWLRE